MVPTDVGPPANKNSLNRYSSTYLIKFQGNKYSREISFTDDGRFIMFQDYYLDDKLSAFQVIELKKYVNYRLYAAFEESWKKDLRAQYGKESKEGEGGAVQIEIPWEPPKIVQGIIGEGKSNIRVTGMRSITFSGRSQWEDGIENTGTFKQSKFPTLQMEQKSRFKVTGTIGSKITVEVDQDSERHTELSNTIKLRYTGEEDEILQSIEAGNTNLALPNARFIGYSENVQGLFGIKASAKVGNLDVTVITSQEKGSNEKATFSAGASVSPPREIRDYNYLSDRYFWLGRSFDPLTDSLVSVELYESSENPSDIRGTACVTPIDGAPYITDEEMLRAEFEERSFKRYDSNQFTLYKQSWYFVLDHTLGQGQALGAFIIYDNYSNPGNVIRDTIGNLAYIPDPANPDSTTLVLKLIKDNSPDSTFTTWDYMWRNVYNLGVRNVSAEGFELKILKGGGGDQGLINDDEDQNGTCFITLLGLDSLNNNTNQPGPDCLFDFNNTVLDAGRGHVIFPHGRPFDFDSLETRVPLIYTLQPGTPRIEETEYYLYVITSEKASTFSLGRANIIEGSETVRLGDGTPLHRGTDYNINYDIGQITFLSDEATNPGANVSVDFEYAPFFLPEKKSLFGVAGQYHLFDNSNISIAAMYRSESVTDPRPRVGREPKKGFVWDANFAFNFEPGIMTSLVDVLPLIEADAKSSLNLSGEVAQSFPNPNTKDRAYIDDFEGTRNYTDLSNRRGIWTACSPPLDENGDPLPLENKTSLWWYNPFDPIRLTSIWPNRQVQTQDDRHDVLFLTFFPDTASAAPESSWAGIVRPIYTGLADQSLTKFIEFWYKPDPNVLSGAPMLHLNFGLISEDIDGDGIKDTEDKLNGREDGIFQHQEDIGLDGLASPDEPGYTIDPPNPNLDPSGDDWAYNDDNPNDFSRINGTEGNRNDPDRRGRFDTEDINNNGSLDTQNGYYEYIIDLDDPDYYVESTDSGWHFIRIPLQDSNAYNLIGAEGSADFSRINYSRMWLTGGTEQYTLRIALFQLVGNKWRELPIAVPEGDSLSLLRDEKFEITVKNTQENSDYYAPPGIAGELDRKTGIREKEQSLVLSYQNLNTGHEAEAYWQLYQPENYTLYNRMKMFVHGDLNNVDSLVTFFFRLGQDSSNFYEYRTILEPGWSENNEVDLDFTEITRLKYELQKRMAVDTSVVADTTDGHYRVKGNPSLSSVRRFTVGVFVNLPDSAVFDPSAPPVSGEVWLDELRVTEIRRKSDFAGRMQLSAKFSDFFDANLTYSKEGADFFPLSAKTPKGATVISRSVRLTSRMDRLLPPSLGFSVPVSYSWQNSLSLPRLQPGSDIILEDNTRRTERTESTTKVYSISQSFNRNTKNPIWNITLNRIKTAYTYSSTFGRSPASPITEQARYKGTGSWDLTPRSKPSFRPFSWAKYLFLPSSLYDSRLAYLPTKLNFSGELNGTNSYAVNQRGIPTTSRIKDLSLNAATGLGLFPSMRSNYSMSMVRDISDPERFKLSINPAKLKLGHEREFQQRFDVNYQPKFTKYFDQKVAFNSSYAENSDFKRNPDSTRTTTMQAATRIDLTFKFSELFPRRARRNEPQRRGQPKEENGGEPQEDDELDDEKKRMSPKDLLGGMFNTLKSIKPIRGSYIKDKRLTQQGLLSRPAWGYLFGISENPKANSKATTGGNPNQSVFSETFKIDSGIKPAKNLDIGVSYNNKKTITRSSNQPTRAVSITFPDITVNFSGLEEFFIFREYSRSVIYQFVYSRKIDRNSFEDTGEIQNRDTIKRFAPLIGLNFSFKNKIKANIRFDITKTVEENLRSVGQANRNTFENITDFKIGVSYSFTAPKGLKLPFLRNIKFNSQLSMSLDVTIRNTKSESVTNGTRSTDIDKRNVSIVPRLNYQFSRSITGGINARWEDSNDKVQERKRHVRELGLSTEIRF